MSKNTWVYLYGDECSEIWEHFGFDNPVLKKWCDTEGYEGSELRKYLTENHSVSFTQVKYGEYTMKRKD